MGKVVLDISMSLDGFVAGLNDGPENGLGDGGMRLHDWLFSGETASRYNEFFKLSGSSREVFDELFETTGAIIAGRRTYDLVDGWGGSHPIHSVPVFVLSHNIPEVVPKGATPFTFVTDGIESALKQAKAAAGDKNVYVLGGANIAQQGLKAGLVDEIHIHFVPVLLGGGVRLFDNLGTTPIELEIMRVVEGFGVTHLKYRMVK